MILLALCKSLTIYAGAVTYSLSANVDIIGCLGDALSIEPWSEVCERGHDVAEGIQSAGS